MKNNIILHGNWAGIRAGTSRIFFSIILVSKQPSKVKFWTSKLTFGPQNAKIWTYKLKSQHLVINLDQGPTLKCAPGHKSMEDFKIIKSYWLKSGVVQNQNRHISFLNIPIFKKCVFLDLGHFFQKWLPRANHYAHETRSEILCRTPVSILRDLSPRPQNLRKTSEYSFLAWMSMFSWVIGVIWDLA